jgi:tetratricopeptide (TPR) repeat protein
MEPAEAHLTEAVRMLRDLGSHERLAFTLVVLGAAKHIRGELDAAEQDYRESLALGRSLGDRNTVATALANLGEVKLATRHTAEAAVLLTEALGTYYELGVRNAVAYCLELLAGIALTDNQYARSATLFGAADRLREVLDAPVEPYNQARYDRDLAASRQGCGDGAFDLAWEAGRDMGLDDAVVFARDVAPEAAAAAG